MVWMPPTGTRRAVVLDFDGVIHAYTSPWVDVETVCDGPVPGAREAVAKLRERFDVVVMSARCNEPGGVRAVKQWLDLHGIEVDAVAAGEKPGAVAYADDRGFRFDGTWDFVDEWVANGTPMPWNKREDIV